MDSDTIDMAATIRRLNEKDIGAASTRLLFLQRSLADNGVDSGWLEVRMSRGGETPVKWAWLTPWKKHPKGGEEQAVFVLRTGQSYWTINADEYSRDGLVDHYQDQGWTVYSMEDQSERWNSRYNQKAFAEILWQGKQALQHEIDYLATQVHATQLDHNTQPLVDAPERPSRRL